MILEYMVNAQLYDAAEQNKAPEWLQLSWLCVYGELVKDVGSGWLA